jgi:hypothetical protein
VVNPVSLPHGRFTQIGYVVFLALLGASLNIAAYGFRYPLGGDYDFQLPLLNWIRNPALYPGDPIREAYARFPTLFWPVVAALSKLFSTEHVLGRWRSAVTLAALTIYIDAVPFFHTACAFAIFALIVWRKQIRRIGPAACLGFVICVPWLLTSEKALRVSFPRNYLQALLLIFPFHFTIRWTPVGSLLRGATLVAVMGCMCHVARKAKLNIQTTLETLLFAYLAVVLSGILLGAFYLTPTVARVSLPRADSFLIIYALLLIQVYGVNLLTQRQPDVPATARLLGVLAIVLPFSIRLVSPLFFLTFVLWTDPRKHMEGVLQKLPQRYTRWLSAVSMPRLAAILCTAGVMLTLYHQMRSPTRLWRLVFVQNSKEQSCYEVQEWARRRTPVEARFLVPPVGCGFRSISERSSWGEWRDGLAAWHYPPFADVFLQRVLEIGNLPGARRTRSDQEDCDALIERSYKGESWNSLRMIALENKLDYIIQFADVEYPAEPAFRNHWYAVYSVGR